MPAADRLRLMYEGSVKRVWAAPDTDESLWFSFTDDYSVFDWGKMPDTIQNKGLALTLLGAFFFEQLSKKELWQTLPGHQALQKFDKEWLSQRWQHPLYKKLCESGARSHFKGLSSGEQKLNTLSAAPSLGEPVMMEVERAEVVRPISHVIAGNQVYFYDQSFLPKTRLIPLEIVFRFGMPAGSSLKERLEREPEYLRTLGLDRMPISGEMFAHPVVELFTKLEPKDRLLSLQEAVLMAGLSAAQFEEMIEFATDISIALFAIFGERGIELWDGKVEMIVSHGEVILADSIGPDELRLIHDGCQLSKEMIRQVYRGTVWEKSIKEAQSKARINPGSDWKELCLQELNSAPEPLTPHAKRIIDQLYGVLTNHMLDYPVFDEHPPLSEYVRLVPSLIEKEQTPARSK